MIAIRQEIAQVESGRFKIEASALRHAPHTVYDIADDDWKRSYSRADGSFPPGVSRMDNIGRRWDAWRTSGDRNLVCSCPPIVDFAQAAE